MTISLPSNPTLLQVKHQAKDILKAHKAGEDSACGTLKLLSKFAGKSNHEILSAVVSLQEVQHSLALSYGFESWKELKKSVESHRRERIEAAVMFADVTGSTKLYETLGDTVADRVLVKALAMMEQRTALYNGHVIKTIGDEVMCRFPSADECVNAAKDICGQLDAGLEGEEIRVTVKTGLHFGPAVLDLKDGDVFGDAVNVAARMQGISGPEQIITTEATVKLLSSELADTARLFDEAQVQGKSEDMSIYQIIWKNEDLTSATTRGE